MRSALEALRSEAGEEMVLQNNYFIEKILPHAVLRKLSDEEMAEYRRPFAEPGEGRRPTPTWPREIPIEGEPADVHAIATAYADWLGKSNVPKLFLKAEPGAILANDSLVNLVRGWPVLTEKTGEGDPFCSGRFVGRGRAGHRWLDGGVGLTGAMQGHDGVASYRLARRSRQLKRGKREVTWTKRPTLIPEHRAACPR
jgi:hypothetical protein